MSELLLKRKFRAAIGVWTEAYETRSGSGVGYPDLQMLVGRLLVPVELKAGGVENGRLRCSEIRPSQISWHHEFLKAGGKSFIVVCWSYGGLNAWAIPSTDREVTSKWKQGWDLNLCEKWIGKGVVTISLSSLARDILLF